VTLKNAVMGALATPGSAEIIVLARKCSRVTFSVKSLMEPYYLKHFLTSKKIPEAFSHF
jgi:hypothetical protein